MFLCLDFACVWGTRCHRLVWSPILEEFLPYLQTSLIAKYISKRCFACTILLMLLAVNRPPCLTQFFFPFRLNDKKRRQHIHLFLLLHSINDVIQVSENACVNVTLLTFNIFEYFFYEKIIILCCMSFDVYSAKLELYSHFWIIT